jgi:HEPN domain-containing protein
MDLARHLVGLAADDEFAARALLPIEGVTDGVLGFHTQQAVEKSLKGVLAFRQIEFPFTHDLDGLIRLCQKNDIELPEELTGIDDLSPFAAGLRYGASPAARLNRDQALKWAALAVEWARQQIEPKERTEDAGSDTSDPQ